MLSFMAKKYRTHLFTHSRASETIHQQRFRVTNSHRCWLHKNASIHRQPLSGCRGMRTSHVFRASHRIWPKSLECCCGMLVVLLHRTKWIVVGGARCFARFQVIRALFPRISIEHDGYGCTTQLDSFIFLFVSSRAHAAFVAFDAVLIDRIRARGHIY